MNINAWVETAAGHPLVEAAGWSLVHFLWQAVLIAMVVASMLALLRKQTAHARYLLASTGLLLMAIAPVVTFAWLLNCPSQREHVADTLNGVRPEAVATASVKHTLLNEMAMDRAVEAVEMREAETAAAPDSLLSTPIDSKMVRQAFGHEQLTWAATRMRPMLPWLVLAWTAGVLVLGVRLGAGYWRVRKWRREATIPADDRLMSLAGKICSRLCPKLRVKILVSAELAAPAVIGWIRPAVLVPVSFTTSLTSAEIESILAHELAHICRHDWIINMCQSVIETLLFYHPAVWWLSARIRAERENCCDDIAVEVCGSRVVFARALARMEEMRCRSAALAVAADGSSLLARIRRIAGTNDCQPARWPTGIIALVAVLLVVGGLWISAIGAERNRTQPGDETFSETMTPADDDRYETKKNESVVVDSKTGQERNVFENIRIWSNADRDPALVSMMYSSAMRYTFVPARIARQLEAKDLGSIDFGEAAPARNAPAQVMLDGTADTKPGKELAGEADPPSPNPMSPGRIFVDELTGPAGDDCTIVPYPEDAIWIPAHLGIYGMNQTQQRAFRIVRIEKVDLGVGPSFGPVNALVLDDANSDFGVLGNNWSRQCRGERGEGLWHSAVDGAFYFMAPPERPAPPAPRPPQGPGSVRVTSSGSRRATPRADRPGVKVLATHTYPLDHRESTDWVTLKGVRVPVDDGVSHDGVTVYVSLMQDVVAVGSESKEVLWNLDWSKSQPVWETVSIVELERDSGRRLAVELYAADARTDELIYRYYDLVSGDQVKPPVGQVSGRPRSSPLSFRIAGSDGDRVTAMEIDAFGHGRSAAELVRHFSFPNPSPSRFQRGNSTTNMETIVSAIKPDYLLANAMDAREVCLSLPEGSGMRAEFHGDRVEITNQGQTTTIVVTNGRVELLDGGGVIRAKATADGGAEQLVVECREADGEVAMTLRARRAKPDPGYPQPPVQVRMNPDTGSPADEEDPPHRSIRYEIQQKKDGGEPLVRMKMKWRYEMKRLAEEAMAETGKTLEELISGSDHDEPDDGNQEHQQPPADSALQFPANPPPIPEPRFIDRVIREKQQLDGLPQSLLAEAELGSAGDGTSYNRNQTGESDYPQSRVRQVDQRQVDQPDAGSTNWGALAWSSGLRSRLTLQTEKPQIGQPLLFTLEVKNFGDKATEIDPQRYVPFRVLRVQNRDFTSAAPFIGMTPQTSGMKITLEPGESVVLWKDVDLTRLFLLSEEKDYFVLAEGGEWAMQALWQDSNRVQVMPEAGELPPLQKLIGDLLGQVPEGWKITKGYGAVFLSLQPTNLKADATTIQLVFPDEDGEQRLADSQRRSGDDLTALGPTVLGNAFILAPGKASSVWSDYRETIGQSVKKILGTVQPDEQSDDHPAADRAPNQPWSVSGTVTDSDGKPIGGATVKAFCGIGSLRNTGSGVTDDQGHYQFRFGPGIFGGDPKQVQAATISVFLDGFAERNLHRQGDCIAALEKPDEINWGDRTEEYLFLPDQPRVIDFTMVPASRMQGRLFIGDTGKPAAGYKVSLTGPELPPSASVIDQVTVGDDGKFEIADIPAGFPFQILVEPDKRGTPWNGWASPSMVFVAGDGGTHIKYVRGGQTVDFSFQFLHIQVHGEGVNWKQALANAAEKPLALTWDGLSTDQMISAGMAFLELGK